ncbi:BNR repeat-containing protein [Flavisolibacter ginsenosidimutans]|nr:BNR repeat-containing protein [Flavisolibacter ginsenosidimutans]
MKVLFRIAVMISSVVAVAQSGSDVTVFNVDNGWANNSVNTVVFRKNSLVSFKDTQFISFYDKDRYVVLGKRKLGEAKWILKKTVYQGHITDAHNCISIMIDGEGFLHMAWDHHNNPLRYCRSIAPGSLDLTDKMPMTGKAEDKVSYPEFHKLPNGDLLFFYRDGGSGNGNLVLNKYNLATKQWTQLQQNLIDGEGQRNAYWQACVDAKGTIHISWVWRESPDVASNHDMGYACSKDGGFTWKKSTGEKYSLPITQKSAEYAVHIPQNSELINQTSMTTDEEGRPFIATYWRDAGTTVPQYHIIYRAKKDWKVLPLNFRKTPFSLSGQGSKRIPVARPQLLVKGKGEKAKAVLLFRDEERGGKVSVATIDKIERNKCKLFDLTQTSVGSWEPTYDTELWKEKHVLNLFVQKVEQVDAEGVANMPPQPVQVLEWKPKF